MLKQDCGTYLRGNGFVFGRYLEFLKRCIWKERQELYIQIKVYRFYSEGSGELCESFTWDLLSLFSEAVVGYLELGGDGLQMHCAFVCGVFVKRYGLHDGR